MDRIPEPEVMDGALQSRAYAEADFEEPNQTFVDALVSRCAPLPQRARVIDLGCGPGDITHRLASRWRDWSVLGVDASEEMLKFGRARVKDSPNKEIDFVQALIPSPLLPEGSFDVLVSNSLLHHLPDPSVLWSTILAVGRPGAKVMVMDLRRPASEEDAHALVEQYSADEPEVLRRDFFLSLRAAFRKEEVEEQLRTAGLEGLQVEVTSDRHLLVHGSLPG